MLKKQLQKNIRNVDIDFWRGIVLIIIMINHIPGNILENFTPRNYGFSDSAEAFVFISGFSVAMAYYARMDQYGIAGIMRRCLRRAFLLYRTHLLLTVLALVLFVIGYAICKDETLLSEHGRHYIFDDTVKGVTGVILLSLQFGYLNILPLYIVLMLWAPIALILFRANRTVALVVSLTIYGLARLGILALPNWPEQGYWFLNPYAWQFVFTIGIYAGILYREDRLPSLRCMFKTSLCISIISGFIVLNGFGFFPKLFGNIGPYLDLEKGHLGIGRIIHFLALAIVLVKITPEFFIKDSLWGREFQQVGRHGLPIFAVGTLLSCAGQVLFKIIAVKSSLKPEWVCAVFTVFCILVLVFIAHYLEKKDKAKQTNQCLESAG